MSRPVGIAVQILVSRDGTVEDHCLLGIDPEGADYRKAATQALESWRFRPASVQGEPVDALISLYVNWKGIKPPLLWTESLPSDAFGWEPPRTLGSQSP